MSNKVFFIFFLLLLLSASISFANGSKKFKIILPLQKSIFNEDYTSIVIKKIDNSLRKIDIIENGIFVGEIRTDEDRDVYCKTVNLKFGINKIELIGYTDDSTSTNAFIEVFHRAQIHKGNYEAPDGYRKNFFHNNRSERICRKCHNMSTDSRAKRIKHIPSSKINSTKFNVLNRPEDSNCYTCHKAIISKKYNHNPAVNFLCTTCHNGKSGKFNAKDSGKSKYLMPDPIMNRCFNCHNNIKHISSNTSEHAPMSLGRCNKCHNPHSSNNSFHLRKPIWELCTTCHTAKAYDKHVIGSFVFNRNKGGHPTRGVADPSRPGRELVCTSCHNPHGSSGIFLLRTEGKTSYSICKRCHKK